MTSAQPRNLCPRPRHWVGRVQGGVLLDMAVTPHRGSTPWAAVVWPDERAPEGWARAALAPGPHRRGYVAARWTTSPEGHRHVTSLLTPGDVIEFGADYARPRRLRRAETVAVRWYGVVLATHPERLVAWGPYPDQGKAWDVAQQAMATWRETLEVHVPGVTDGSPPEVHPAPDPSHELPGPVAPVSPSAPGPAAYHARGAGSVVRRDPVGGESPLRPPRRWTPDGFGWGHDAETACELAYALVADATGSPDVARRLAPRYATEVLARLPPGQPWSLTVDHVRAWSTDAALKAGLNPSWPTPAVAAPASPAAEVGL